MYDIKVKTEMEAKSVDTGMNSVIFTNRDYKLWSTFSGYRRNLSVRVGEGVRNVSLKGGGGEGSQSLALGFYSVYDIEVKTEMEAKCMDAGMNSMTFTNGEIINTINS